MTNIEFAEKIKGYLKGSKAKAKKYEDTVAVNFTFIAVVIGALLMAGLVALFNNVIMPRVNTEVTELFDAAG